MLLNAAYYVHGVLAPILPVELSPGTKQAIRNCITHVEDSISCVFSVPLAVTDPADALDNTKED